MDKFLIRIIKGAIISVIASKIVDVASDKVIKVANETKDKIKKSETIKGIKKDFELRRQGVITVDYQEIED